MKTVRATFVGTLLAVCSSSLLYVNLLMTSVFPDEMQSGPWTNVYVFPSNATSILNSVGMLVASGTLVTAVGNITVAQTLFRVSSSRKERVQPEPANESAGKYEANASSLEAE